MIETFSEAIYELEEENKSSLSLTFPKIFD